MQPLVPPNQNPPAQNPTVQHPPHLSPAEFVAPTRENYDPAPSRWGYRWQRWWLSPIFRFSIRFALPVALIALFAAGYLMDAENRAALQAQIAQAQEEFADQPELAVTQLLIDGGGHQVAADIRAALGLEFPISSRRLDLVALREQIMALPSVDAAHLRFEPAGVLALTVAENIAVAIWQNGQAAFEIDGDGQILRPATQSAGLPLFGGRSGPMDVATARAIYANAGPVTPHILGLVHVGERRWDIVLKNNMRLMLPETDPVQALEEIIILAQNHELLERDILRVDFRNIRRPVIQIGPGSAHSIREIYGNSNEGLLNE